MCVGEGEGGRVLEDIELVSLGGCDVMRCHVMSCDVMHIGQG